MASINKVKFVGLVGVSMVFVANATWAQNTKCILGKAYPMCSVTEEEMESFQVPASAATDAPPRTFRLSTESGSYNISAPPVGLYKVEALKT